jgi:hypothetical protein
LANLLAGAADGKKLFEILDVEQYDSGHDDMEEGAEHDHQESYVEDEIVPNEQKFLVTGEAVNPANADNAVEDAAPDSLISQEEHETDLDTGEADTAYAVIDSQEGLNDLDSIQEDQKTQSSVAETQDSLNAGARPGGEIPDQHEELSANSEQVNSLQQIQQSEGEKQATQATELEDEGDLIDYSEDEQELGEASTHDLSENGNEPFIISCILPLHCVCSKCAAHFIAQQDAINADLDRRSVSRAESNERQNHLSEPNPTASQPRGINTNSTDTSSLVRSAGGHATAQGVLAQSEAGQVLEEDDDYLDLSPTGADEANTLPSKETINGTNDDNGEPIPDSLYQQNDEYEVNLVDENDYEQEAENSEEFADEVLVNWSNTLPKAEEATYDNLEHDEPAGSSATLSAGDAHVDETTPTPEQRPLDHLEGPLDAVENQDEDEIDYDDNDYGQEVNASIPEAQTSPVSTNGGTTKRPRQDDDDEFALEDPGRFLTLIFTLTDND